METNKLVTKKFIHLGLGWIGDRGGGLERYQHGICNAHARMGCDVTAWVQSRTAIDSNITYPVIAYASPEEGRSAKIGKLTSIAAGRFQDPDFTFVSHHASVSGPLFRLARRVPHVVHFQGPWADEAAVEGAPWWKTALQRRQELRVYQAADSLITLSDAFKQLVVRRYGVKPECVHVVPGAIDAEAADREVSRAAAREQLGWPKDRPIVLTMRRLVKRVGVDVLVEAIGKLIRRDAAHCDLLVMIGGTGPLGDALRARISEMGLENHVRLLGFVPDNDLQIAYRAADYSIVPTQSLEGFGLVTLESMATGTPAIVTPIGSLPEVLGPLSESLVLAGPTADDIATGLHSILRGELKIPNENDCRRYVRENFDWSVIAPRVLDVYLNAR